MMKVLKSRSRMGSTSMVLPIEGKNKKSDFFLSLKCFVYFGWFVGIFPVNFDRNLQKFKFKLCSLTSLFSIVRSVLLLLLLSVPFFVRPSLEELMESRTNITKTTSTNGSAIWNKMDEVTATMNFATFILNWFGWFFPFVFGHYMAKPFSKITELDVEEDSGTFEEKKMSFKIVSLVFKYFLLFFCFWTLYGKTFQQDY